MRARVHEERDGDGGDLVAALAGELGRDHAAELGVRERPGRRGAGAGARPGSNRRTSIRHGFARHGLTQGHGVTHAHAHLGSASRFATWIVHA
jgi:hypothetical protein